MPQQEYALESHHDNTIEMVFAKLKTLFRKAETRSVEDSWRKVGTLLDEFDPKEYPAYFRHAGYHSKID